MARRIRAYRIIGRLQKNIGGMALRLGNQGSRFESFIIPTVIFLLRFQILVNIRFLKSIISKNMGFSTKFRLFW